MREIVIFVTLVVVIVPFEVFLSWTLIDFVSLEISSSLLIENGVSYYQLCWMVTFHVT